MTLLLAFAATLSLAVLVSGLAARSVLSTAALFLVAGFLLGLPANGPVPADEPLVRALAELALFSVLFTDGMRAGLGDLASSWRLPGRALLLGMPLTLAGTAVLGHYVAGLPWAPAFLLGAVLSPTDPVLAAAIVGRERVPLRLRRLLNVESGLNDGLALPVVIVLLAVVGGEAEVGDAVLEMVAGVAIGVAAPLALLGLERTRPFAATGVYEPLNGFAIGLLVYALTTTLHANVFLAAFCAGVTVASVAPPTREAFHGFGELVTELLKLAALFVFGTLISPAFLGEISVGGYVFAVLTLLLVRPASLTLALAGGGLGRRELAVAAWFGPKGFASVVYGLLILQAGIPGADELFHLVAAVTALSMLAHSSTDVPIAKRFGPTLS
ncbi:MAG: cation:proton antiporter [Actinomycetota bacterium]|nr:cation:proton antiporter [Actinomycetota bacterium]